MPKFQFRFLGPGYLVEDEEFAELSSQNAARAEAEAPAREMIAEALFATRNEHVATIETLDETGHCIERVQVIDVLPVMALPVVRDC